MKTNIYIIAFACVATAFTGCSPDYNYDGEYDVAGYFSGSDPRNNLISFPSNVQEYDNAFTAGIPVGQDSHTFTFTARISRNLTAPTKVQVVYAADAPLLTTTYKDYQVVAAKQLAIPNNGAFEWNKDSIQQQVALTVNSLGTLTKPSVVPVRITPTTDALSSPSTAKQDYAYILIQPKEMWSAELDGDGSTVRMTGLGNSYTGSTALNVLFATEKVVRENCKVGLERDNTLFKSNSGKELAPEGISTTTQVDATNQQYVQATVQLQHAEKFTVAGEYVLPMRAVFYDKDGKKHNIAGGEVLIPINVVDIAFANAAATPSGTMIPGSNYQLSLSTPLQYGTIENLTDGDTEQYGYLPHGTSTLTIDLNQTTTVKGIRIGMYILTGFEYYTDKVRVYGSTDGAKWLPLSEDIRLHETTWNNINATKSVNVRYLKLEFSVSDSYGSLSEIEVFK